MNNDNRTYSNKRSDCRMLFNIRIISMKTLTTIFIVLSVLVCSTASASSQTEHDKQLDCLAEAIYFESRGETFLGMLAVGTVIMNRVEHKKFPNTICSVVYAGRHRNGKPLRNKCQFSYYCDGKPEHLKDSFAKTESYNIANFVMVGARVGHLSKALYYHASYVNPSWPYKRLLVLGTHIFYGEEDG